MGAPYSLIMIESLHCQSALPICHDCDVTWKLSWLWCILEAVMIVMYPGSCHGCDVSWKLSWLWFSLEAVMIVMYPGSCHDCDVSRKLSWLWCILEAVMIVMYPGSCHDCDVSWKLSWLWCILEAVMIERCTAKSSHLINHQHMWGTCLETMLGKSVVEQKEGWRWHESKLPSDEGKVGEGQPRILSLDI